MNQSTKSFIFLAIFTLQCGNSLAADPPSSKIDSDNVLITDGEYIYEPIFGGGLYYYETGPEDGMPLVLVHGLGVEGLSYWRYVAEELAKTYRVILIDLPGFGRSGRENEIYSPERYAKFLDWFIKERNIAPVTLIGHSMGGAIALYYAATYPQNLKQLIILDAAGVLHQAAFTKHFVEIAELDQPVLDSLTRNPISQANELMSAILTKAERFSKPFKFMLDSPTLSKYLLNGVSPTVIAGFALAETDFSDVIPKINTPTTIIWGRDDEIAPPRLAHVLNKRIDDSQLFIIEAGHSPMVDNIEATNETLKRALSKPVDETKNQSYKSVALVKRDRKGSCTNQDGMYFSGYYSELRIVECSRVEIYKVSTPSLIISGSKVNIFSGHFHSTETPIIVHNSILRMTNSAVSGNVGIEVTDSSLDLAGVDIIAKQSGIKIEDSSTVICSLCEFDAPDIQGSVHGLYNLDSGDYL